MDGCFCDRLILVKALPTMAQGSIPMRCNGGIEDKKEADSDEIRTREGNPSRIWCRT